MKKILSILCVLSLIMSIAIIPCGFSASAKMIADTEESVVQKSEKYVYNFDIDYSEEKAGNIIGNDGSYINYSTTHAVDSSIVTEENGNKYFSHIRTNGGSSSFVRTPYILKNRTYYKVSFKYKLEGAAKKNNFNNHPRFIAATGNNSWDAYYVGNDYTTNQPCNIGGTILSEDGAFYTDGNLNLDVHSDWRTKSSVIYTADIINAKHSTQQYFSLFFFSNDSTYISLCIDDISIEPIAIEDLTSQSKTWNFDSKDEILRSYWDVAQVDTENGYLSVNAQKHTYAHLGFGLDYILKPETAYNVSISYRITKTAGIKNFGLYGEINTLNVSAMNNQLVAFDCSQSNDFVTKNYSFKTDAKGTNDEWLAVHFETTDGPIFDIDWITISEAPAEGETYVYDYETTFTENSKGNLIGADGSYTQYSATNAPDTLIATEENGNNYYKHVGAGGGTTFTRTTYELSNNTYYRVSFKYKFEGTSFNHWPRFIAATSLNGWNGYGDANDYLKTCNISGNTLSDSGTYYTDGVFYPKANSTSAWMTHTEIIYTANIIDSAVGINSNKYLGIYFMPHDSNYTSFSIDDISITPLYNTDFSADTKMFNFDSANDVSSSYKEAFTVDETNGYLNIQKDACLWDRAATMVEYMLEPETTYTAKIRYKVSKTVNNNNFGLYSAKKSSTSAQVAAKKLATLDATVTNGFVEKYCSFTTGADDGTNQWLYFYVEPQAGGVIIEIDYILINKLSDDISNVSIFDFEYEDDYFVYSAGEISSEFETEGTGNKYLHAYSHSEDANPYVAIRTRFDLKANTDYTVSFQYKTQGGIGKTNFVAGGNFNGWGFWQYPQCSEIEKRGNLLNGDAEYTDSQGYACRPDANLGLKGDNKWHSVTASFNTGSIVRDTNKYFGMILMFNPNEELREICIDDLVIVENTTDIIIYNYDDGSGTLKFAKADSVAPNLGDKDGYLFKGWFTDKGCTVPYVYSTDEATPNMVYAGYVIDINEDGKGNLLDLIRLKKIAAKEITKYVSAADYNKDNVVDSLDLSNYKQCLLNK